MFDFESNFFARMVCYFANLLYYLNRICYNVYHSSLLNTFGKDEAMFAKEIKMTGGSVRIGLPTGGTAPDDTTNSLWDAALNACKENRFDHAQYIWSWCQEHPDKQPTACVIRGGAGQEAWDGRYQAFRSQDIGFRPVLWLASSPGLDESLFANRPNGTIVRALTMLLDGEPVQVSRDSTRAPKMYPFPAKIDFTDQITDARYLIPWYIFNGFGMASKVLLPHISWLNLRDQSFVAD